MTKISSGRLLWGKRGATRVQGTQGGAFVGEAAPDAAVGGAEAGAADCLGAAAGA